MVSPPEIRVFELGRPIVDFTLDGDDRIWVSLDPNWSSDEATLFNDAVKLLTWADGQVGFTIFC